MILFACIKLIIVFLQVSTTWQLNTSSYVGNDGGKSCQTTHMWYFHSRPLWTGHASTKLIYLVIIIIIIFIVIIVIVIIIIIFIVIIITGAVVISTPCQIRRESRK